MYERDISKQVVSKFGTGKAIVIVGARQVGKTTLIREFLKESDYLFLDGDDPTVRAVLTHPNTEQIRRVIGAKRVVFIDEAQRIQGIGITSKIITDQFKDVQLIVSGSSSFDLSSQINEPLTGRKWEYELFPISFCEYEKKHGYLTALQQIENRLLFGFYPEILNNEGEEIPRLKQLVNSYLYADILSYSRIRKPQIVEKLVQALALQIGCEVSYNELSQTVGVDKNTIISYIDILEKAYVVFRLRSFSKNLRNEIRKNRKIYFYDLGVRNMVIGDFRNIQLRQDKGALWESFLIVEKLKQNKNSQNLAKSYFWRTKQQQEVDYVEVREQGVFGFEFKWNAKSKTRRSKTFEKAYNTKVQVIDRDNFREFLELD